MRKNGSSLHPSPLFSISLRVICVITLLFLSHISVVAQQVFSISGTISDKATGETLTGATIYPKSNPSSAVYSNAYGYYALSLAKGTHTIVVNYIGYSSLEYSVEVQENIRKNFQIQPASTQLDEVVVSAIKRNETILSDKIGVEKLEIQSIQKIPVLFGEQDILKTLTLTPGVKTMGEGSGGMYVRGGNNSHNLILLDESMVYNANHLLGFFSTFNGDAIKDVTLYKGTAGAEYGGRLASVMDVRMKDGNNQHYHVSGGIGLISSRISVEGPIIRNKGSFLLTARRTYADLFLKLSSDPLLNNNQLYFYDINAKANYQLNDNNRLFISAYAGRDVFSFFDRFSMNWGNITATVRWNHIFNNRLFSNTSFIYSDYGYKVGINLAENSFSLLSQINNVQLKHDYQYFINPHNTLSFGLQLTHHRITPGQLSTESTLFQPFKLQEKYAFESSLYITNNWKPNYHWNVSYGVRGNIFSLLGGGDFYTYLNDGTIQTSFYDYNQFVKTYLYIEPRINIAYILNDANSFKMSYTRNTQNLHLITNSTSSVPTDIWIPSSKNIKPQISDQVSTGYFVHFLDDTYQVSSEIYYKWMQNQLDLKNGANIQANEYIENELLVGNGRAYGLEIMLKKQYGALSGWIGYTLSRTENQIEGINNGNWYPARHDATHDVSVVAIYELSKKWTLSSTWVYNTGNAVTFPSGKYQVDGETILLYTNRNASRMPHYHRMDIGATRYFKKSKRFESSLNFSVYNAYGRKNAFTIDFEQDENDPDKINAVKTYLFTFMPSITYNFKF